jgi:hypothetical protein
MTIGLAIQSKAHPRAERGLDLYETPPVVVRALLKVERIPHKVWEPAAGNGSIVRILEAVGHHVVAKDIATGTDFLACSKSLGDGIITNPAYQSAALFAAHAIRLCPWSALLLRLVFLEAGNPRTETGRAPRFWLDEHPPVRVQIFRNRFLASTRAIHHAKTRSASDRAPQAEPEGRS